MKIVNEIRIVCATCGSDMEYKTDAVVTSQGVLQTLAVAVCDRCVRDTFDEAFKLMSEKAVSAAEAAESTHCADSIHPDDECTDPMC
jgi:hypothetical protein